MEWGDLSFSTESIGNFIGVCPSKTKNLKAAVQPIPKSRVVNSRDVKLIYLQK
jgi:hypothetical protein